MPPAAAIPAGAALVGSFLQSNSAKNAQKANLSQETSLDNQMLGIYNNLMGKYNSLWSGVNPVGALDQAKGFYSSEVSGGLDPAVIGSANAQFQQQNERNLATFKNQLGPYTPNVAGAVRDFGDNEIQGNVSLQQQLAAMNQQVRQQGAAGLTGIGTDVAGIVSGGEGGIASALGGLAQQFGQAGMFNAANQSNPFSALSSILASNPSLLAGIGGANANAGATPPFVGVGLGGPGFGWGDPGPWGTPQPGQGGLGTTGGTGGGLLSGEPNPIG